MEKNVGLSANRHSTGLKTGDYNLFRMIYHRLLHIGHILLTSFNSNSYIHNYFIDSDQFLLK